MSLSCFLQVSGQFTCQSDMSCWHYCLWSMDLWAACFTIYVKLWHLYFIVARIQKWSFAPKCCTHDTEVWGLALFLLCNCCWCSRVPVQMGTVPLFPPRVDSSKGSKLGGWIGPIGVICYQVHTMSLLRSLWQNWHHGSFGLLPCFWWKPHN